MRAKKRVKYSALTYRDCTALTHVLGLMDQYEHRQRGHRSDILQDSIQEAFLDLMGDKRIPEKWERFTNDRQLLKLTEGDIKAILKSRPETAGIPGALSPEIVRLVRELRRLFRFWINIHETRLKTKQYEHESRIETGADFENKLATMAAPEDRPANESDFPADACVLEWYFARNQLGMTRKDTAAGKKRRRKLKEAVKQNWCWQCRDHLTQKLNALGMRNPLKVERTLDLLSGAFDTYGDIARKWGVSQGAVCNFRNNYITPLLRQLLSTAEQEE